MRIIALLVVAMLAGCADSSTPGPADPDDDKFGDVDVGADEGIIRGIVVDPAIVPVEGVTVTLRATGETQVSDPDGAFLFRAVEPGAHFLEAAKVGFVGVQTSVDVVAGEDRPPIVKLQMERDAQYNPFVDTRHWSGFMNCQVGFNVADTVSNAVNPCAALGLADDTLDRIVEEYDVETPDFAQSEMVWTPAQVLAGAMTLQYTRAVNLTELDNYARSSGQSPQIIKADHDLLSRKGVGIDDVLRIRVFAGSSEPATVIAQQDFEVFTNLFYGFIPAEDYLFIEQGTVDPPTA